MIGGRDPNESDLQRQRTVCLLWPILVGASTG